MIANAILICYLLFVNDFLKEVKKSTKQLATYLHRRVGQAVNSPGKLHNVMSHRKKVHPPFPNPCYKKQQSPRIGGCDIANKENELSCEATCLKNCTLIVQHICLTPVILVLHSQKTHNQNSVFVCLFVCFLRFLRTMKQWYKFCSEI